MFASDTLEISIFKNKDITPSLAAHSKWFYGGINHRGNVTAQQFQILLKNIRRHTGRGGGGDNHLYQKDVHRCPRRY